MTFSFSETEINLFSDPDRSEHLLDQLLHNQLSGLEFLHLWPVIQPFFSRSSDADELLLRFVRISQRMFSAASFFNQLRQHEPFRSILFAITENSSYLTDILTRHPEYFYWLCTTGINLNRTNSEEYKEELQSLTKRSTDQNRFAEMLKAFKRREILRIGVRDILDHATFQETVHELSILTDALLQVSLAYFEAEFAEKIAVPKTQFAILALGKLGGNELNYSSDIDLIFLYDKESELITVSGMKSNHHEYFNRLAENLTRFWGEIREGEALFRVDARLRPDGDAGPLARSGAGMQHYYETRGELWERQMLIKARPVAGSIQLAQTFLSMLTPFIYPKTFFYSPLEEIRKIKAVIERKIRLRSEQSSNVKLMEGGIRDIEFITQAQQLLHGGRNKALRDGNTLSALQKLSDNRIISRQEFNQLREAYIFLRKIEHFRQLASGKQTHLLPTQPAQQQQLAKFLHLPNWHETEKAIDEKRRIVRQLFNKFFAAPRHETDETQFPDFRSQPPSQSVLARLQQSGFQNPVQAYRSLHKLVAETWQQQLFHPAEQFNPLFSKVIEQLAKTPLPDQSLSRFTQLVQSYGATNHFLCLLSEQPVFLHFLLDLSVKAPVLVRMLQLEKKYFSLLFGNSAQDSFIFNQIPPEQFMQDKASASMEEFLLQVTKIKNQNWLNIGLLFLKGKISPEDTWSALTRLADWVLQTLTLAICRQQKLKVKNFAILGLGKLGGVELNFGSDLDILCLYSARNLPEPIDLIRFLRQLTRLAAQISPLGHLYKLDLRLRPEGENAPLTISDDSFITYLANRAQLWEKQALLKIRFTAGDQSFGHEIQNRLIENIFTAGPFSTATVDEIVKMRFKIQAEKNKLSDKLNIKTDKGGILDVEFLAQMAGLFWPERFQFRPPLSTLSGLQILQTEKIVSEADGKFMARHFRQLRNIETYLTITLEKSKPEIPDDAQSRHLLAFCFDHDNGETWFKELQNDLENMRNIFLKTAERIKKRKVSDRE